MDSKPKDTLKTKDAIKQLQNEVRNLQVMIASIGAGSLSEQIPPPTEVGGVTVQYSINYKHDGDKSKPIKERGRTISASDIARTSDTAVAELGYALSSQQKVALLRTLLHGGTVGAAELGASTQLSTGSLYHHLRDLMHAGLVLQSARNQYELTARGGRVLLLMLSIASERGLGQ